MLIEPLPEGLQTQEIQAFLWPQTPPGEVDGNDLMQLYVGVFMLVITYSYICYLVQYVHIQC